MCNWENKEIWYNYENENGKLDHETKFIWDQLHCEIK